MTKNTEQTFSTHAFLHMLDELDANLMFAESDIRQSEKIIGCDNLTIAAIAKLEYVLRSFLALCASMQQKHLDSLMQLYSKVLLQSCLKIAKGSLPQLYDRLTNLELHFEQFFAQWYPGKPLPLPKEEGPFYTPEIMDKYHSMLQGKPQEGEWSWVSRQHFRLCMYMLEKLGLVLNALVDGKLPAEGCMKAQQKKRELPPELSTPEALRVLEKLRKGGFLDDYYMPAESLSLTKKAVMAQKISEVLWRENKWTCIEEFWGIKNLSSLFCKGNRQVKMLAFLEKLNKCIYG